MNHSAEIAKIAVIIPAKDEARRIEASVKAAYEIEQVDLVVVVDDGSKDATAALAKGAGAVVVRHAKNLGKAAAMATGAQLVHSRESKNPAESRRALLFIDGDMGASAVQAAPLAKAVLNDGVDMAIALLPPQDGASGFGIVVRTARKGIMKATNFEALQPLSGTRCITRQTWDEVQPLAKGWGVETGLTIDALDKGFWVKEIPCDLHHQPSPPGFTGMWHRAKQLKDVWLALRARRHLGPNQPLSDL